MSYTIELPDTPQEGRFTVELPERSAADSLGRGAGLSARAATTGVMGIPNMLGDAVNTVLNFGIRGVNAATGADVPYLNKPSQATQRLLTKAGLPEAETPGERIMYEGVAPAVLGGGAFAKGAEGLSKLADPGVLKNILGILGSEQGMQAASNASGALSGAVTKESGGGPIAQFVASLIGGAAPPLLKAGGAATLRGVVRGGEEGRQTYETRRQDFADAGIDTPSVGQAAGNRRMQAVESGLSKAPGGAGPMARQAELEAQQISNKVNSLADNYMPGADAARAGTTIEKGVKNFVQRFKGEQEFLYSKLDQHLPKDTRIDVQNTLDTLSAINADIPGAPALSGFFKNAKIDAIKRAAVSDTATPADIAAQLQTARADLANLVGSRNRTTQQGGQLQGLASEMTWGPENAVPVPGMPRVSGRVFSNPDVAKEATVASREVADLARSRSPAIRAAEARVADLEAALDFSQGKLPYEAVKKLRTLVGERITNNSLVDEVPRDKWKAVYGALSEDMGAAARQAGPEAERAFNRANWFTRAGYDRIESVLNRVVGDDTKTPEAIYKAAVSAPEVREGATTINAVMKSLTPEERQTVSAATIKRLGQANPGQQNAAGDAFSTETFLSNWNRFGDDAKRVLFADDAARQGLDDVALAAQRIREGSKVFANPSGTAQAVANYSAGTGALVAGITGNMGAAGAIAAGVAASNVGARLLTNPRFVKWLGQSTRVSPGALPAQLSLLAHEAKEWAPEDRDEANRFITETASRLR